MLISLYEISYYCQLYYEILSIGQLIFEYAVSSE